MVVFGKIQVDQLDKELANKIVPINRIRALINILQEITVEKKFIGHNRGSRVADLQVLPSNLSSSRYCNLTTS
jgi:hypothetical protein